MSCYFIYFFALIRHKWYVFIESCKVGIPWRGFVHDNSKFLPSEFIPYARYWGKKPENRTKVEVDAYKKAIQEHKSRNPHHWEWWVRETKKVIPMTEKYRTEMLCDWRGAGLAYSGRDNAIKHYQDNKKQIIMNKETRNWLEQKIGIRKH